MRFYALEAIVPSGTPLRPETHRSKIKGHIIAGYCQMIDRYFVIVEQGPDSPPAFIHIGQGHCQDQVFPTQASSRDKGLEMPVLFKEPSQTVRHLSDSKLSIIVARFFIPFSGIAQPCNDPCFFHYLLAITTATS